MNNCLRLAALVLVAVVAAGAQAGQDTAAAPGGVAAPATAAASEARVRDRTHADALAQCESAVERSIHEIRGRQVSDLQFGGDARGVASDGDRVDVKGSGRYRRSAGAAPVSFHYTCAYDEVSGATSGVVFRDTDNSPAPALPVWQADLTKIAPEACEAAAAASLQSSHPRASGIVFDGDSRKLEPGGEGRTALAGTGRLVRSPGMQPTVFRYRCEFESSGRLASARAGD
jgi:hypothetical protein